ncbi:MAG: LpxL/LpxP family Kdo(2)-lipid IV(A) lauroyl/palmitoleoyl acyltransferase [Rhodanobacteraceae bacterium]|nr:LpxL/LpxP family Kdo(2)-lipid IV(A) lauroyl/palmitoleoyl acyltransferase [Rhodanobacteraceae bacterium]MDL1870476.1 LpxL/LpxP family Kdo(2)-lipid IV(A) lauroyl/palmitoleoyl acyltransferase [Gammaproteobacteria bacterium PRO6]
MAQSPPPFRLALLSPLHWPAWLGLGLIWLAARLPRRGLMAGARALGGLIARLPGQRRRVAATNLALCFPELDAAARSRLLADNLRDAGCMLAEFALAWLGSDAAIARIPVDIDGLEHLQAARAGGRGVLLVGAHFSHLELCARLVSRRIPIAGMYREHADAAFEWAIKRARLRYAEAMFSKDELRASIRHLKQGGILWYAPDQDMRGKEVVFAPFFGVPAATITATHHLARLSGAAVIAFFHQRTAHGYAIRLAPALADFPSADVVADTTRINACIEAMVRAAPSQYLWLHKRFKTRPPTAAPVYD